MDGDAPAPTTPFLVTRSAAALVLLALATITLQPSARAQGVAQLPLPTKAGEVLVLDDFNNKVTLVDLGLNAFGGNGGAVEPSEGVTMAGRVAAGSTGEHRWT